jgi:hypothetical protein
MSSVSFGSITLHTFAPPQRHDEAWMHSLSAVLAQESRTDAAIGRW